MKNDKVIKEETKKVINELAYQVYHAGYVDGKEDACEKLNAYQNGMQKQQPSEDCISRKAVIQIIENKLNPCTDMFKCLEMSEIKEDIEHLPPVTPQRKKGKWIENLTYDPDIDGRHWYCSECHHEVDYIEYKYDEYCSNCGAKMEENEKTI